ncbi:hypothetical protein [Microbacterium sp. LMI1-1-1.1]|uniref:hypothetical protein n=1 Tax=unclassified Microbacterium TaxID=2609290 RepID=UPI0034675023
MFRSRPMLEDWLEEYAELMPEGAAARVATPDEADGRDGAVVVTQLGDARTSVLLEQPDGSDRWVVTIEAQPQATELTSDALVRLADEFVAVAELCTFLEHKSRRR